MIDFHMHTFLSDGELSPNELVQRARSLGYVGMAITDHADASNIEFLVKELVHFCDSVKNYYSDIVVLPGIELTHVPPDQIDELAEYGKENGIKIVVVHGETVVEPVEKGTNKKAVESKFVDILAHPGLLEEEIAILAAKNGKYVEITSRKGHSITNGHVVKVCRKHKVKMILDTDTHSPNDLISNEKAITILRGAGLDTDELTQVFENSMELLKKVAK